MDRRSDIVELIDYPGYGVDRDGNVYCRRPINGKGPLTDKWRKLRPLIGEPRRYAQVGLFGRLKREIHSLVAMAFLGPRPTGLEVAHKNGNPLDNRADNLEYVTHRENESHKKLHGTSSSGERNSQAKLTNDEVAEIRSALSSCRYGDAARIARKYGVSDATICNIRKRKRWTA